LASPSLFVSYSHRDAGAIEQLRRFLRPLEREQGIAWWDDSRIEEGRDWAAEIAQALDAATAAVLLISQDFIGSEFITRTELPHLLARAEAGELTILPVFLNHSTVELTPYSYVDLRSGAERRVKLTKYQGFGSPDKPLAELKKPQREKVCKELARRLSRLAGEEEPGAAVCELSQALVDAYRQKEELVTAGRDTTAIDGEILALRRRIREGGQLKAGDFLADGRFKLIGQIGHGGFATVWKAYDRKTNQPVAIKVLHVQYAEDRTRRERFFRGARKMAELRHPGIVGVIEEKGEDGGYRFFVMEYVAGDDLREAVLAERLTVDDRLRILLEVGDALDHAHQKGVIHRDVKPANILLDDAGRPKLTDFDLVRALDTTGGTRTGGMLGTFLYAAPEFMRNPKETEAIADVYSLGMTAVFALYGEELPMEVMRDADSLIADLSCSPAVKEVLVTAVDWDRRRRFPSVTAFCSALFDALVLGPEVLEAIVEETDANGIVFVRIPAGTFTMGSADDDPMAYDNEKPAHQVTLSEFWIGKYPITNEQYRRVRPDHQKTEAGELPVIEVSWNDARKFCEQLGYRLPTEAEWEYAARASTRTPWSFGDDEGEIGRYTWYEGNSEYRVHPVGTREPNPWGLHDMHGNVWEWVDDEYERYSPEPQTNPATPSDSRSSAVLRGAFWNTPRDLRSAYRNGLEPEYRDWGFGFRCVRGPHRQP